MYSGEAMTQQIGFQEYPFPVFTTHIKNNSEKYIKNSERIMNIHKFRKDFLKASDLDETLVKRYLGTAPGM